jgi:hypothetical protein
MAQHSDGPRAYVLGPSQQYFNWAAQYHLKGLLIIPILKQRFCISNQGYMVVYFVTSILSFALILISSERVMASRASVSKSTEILFSVATILLLPVSRIS